MSEFGGVSLDAGVTCGRADHCRLIVAALEEVAWRKEAQRLGQIWGEIPGDGSSDEEERIDNESTQAMDNAMNWRAWGEAS